MTGDLVEVTVNGEPRRMPRQSVAALIAGEGYDPGRRGLAVAVNAAVVPRRDWESRTLEPGDAIEIVKPFSGG